MVATSFGAAASASVDWQRPVSWLQNALARQSRSSTQSTRHWWATQKLGAAQSELRSQALLAHRAVVSADASASAMSRSVADHADRAEVGAIAPTVDRSRGRGR